MPVTLVTCAPRRRNGTRRRQPMVAFETVKAPGDPDLVARLATALTPLAQVELAYLFGSYARGRERPESDIDVAIQVSPAAGDARVTLALLLDRLGRVAPSDRLDLALLND